MLSHETHANLWIGQFFLVNFGSNRTQADSTVFVFVWFTPFHHGIILVALSLV